LFQFYAGRLGVRVRVRPSRVASHYLALLNFSAATPINGGERAHYYGEFVHCFHSCLSVLLMFSCCCCSVVLVIRMLIPPLLLLSAPGQQEDSEGTARDYGVFAFFNFHRYSG
jgi:hypothetical protein